MKTIFFLLVVSFTTYSCQAQRGFSNLNERDGKIGIGTNRPDELLTVKGKIHTQEVLVDLNGAVAPDYVFEDYVEGVSVLKPSYKRMTLEALETYIQQYKHLPAIPDAQTLQKEGMLLKEMNLLLLEKIEELTLYTLEQQKEINALKNRMELLEQ